MTNLDARDAWLRQELIRRAVLEACTEAFPVSIAQWGTPARVLRFVGYHSAEFLASSILAPIILRKFHQLSHKEASNAPIPA